MIDNQYLDSTQRDIVPDPINVERMGAAFENFSVRKGDEAARVAYPELRKDGNCAPDGIDQKHSATVNLDRFSDGGDGKTAAGNARPKHDPTKRKDGRKNPPHKAKKNVREMPY